MFVIGHGVRVIGHGVRLGVWGRRMRIHTHDIGIRLSNVRVWALGFKSTAVASLGFQVYGLELGFKVPHGVVRPFHRKSTCPMEST